MGYWFQDSSFLVQGLERFGELDSLRADIICTEWAVEIPGMPSLDAWNFSLYCERMPAIAGLLVWLFTSNS